MRLTRRTLLAGAAATLAAPHALRAATVADDAGRDIVLPAKITRVLPAGPPAAILLYTLAPDLLLGWPHALRPQEYIFLKPDICERPVTGALTSRSQPASIDSIVALKPDIIVDFGDTGERYVSLAKRVQEQTGIPYAVLDGRFLSLSTAYEKLGRLIGRERDGLDYADFVNMTLGVITNRIAYVPREKRLRVYLAEGTDGLTTGLSGSSSVETIELIARNVAGERKGRRLAVSVEQVAAWDPDVIIVADKTFDTSVRTDRAWVKIKAVREGRVHLSPRLPFGWVGSTPSVNRLIGLWWLAKLFYPEIFKDDMRELTRDFYSKFYHVTPTDAEIGHVLAARD